MFVLDTSKMQFLMCVSILLFNIVFPQRAQKSADECQKPERFVRV